LWKFVAERLQPGQFLASPASLITQMTKNWLRAGTNTLRLDEFFPLESFERAMCALNLMAGANADGDSLLLFSSTIQLRAFCQIESVTLFPNEY
jgi:hypothetical protein